MTSSRMQRLMLKSKIRRAVVTGADLHYEGSIAIDEMLLEATDLLPNEQVPVLNCSNSARAQTYVIRGKQESGDIVLNEPHPGVRLDGHRGREAFPPRLRAFRRKQPDHSTETLTEQLPGGFLVR